VAALPGGVLVVNCTTGRMRLFLFHTTRDAAATWAPGLFTGLSSDHRHTLWWSPAPRHPSPCYKIADRHHGETGSHDIRKHDVTDDWGGGWTAMPGATAVSDPYTPIPLPYRRHHLWRLRTCGREAARRCASIHSWVASKPSLKAATRASAADSSASAISDRTRTTREKRTGPAAFTCRHRCPVVPHAHWVSLEQKWRQSSHHVRSDSLIVSRFGRCCRAAGNQIVGYASPFQVTL